MCPLSITVKLKPQDAHFIRKLRCHTTNRSAPCQQIHDRVKQNNYGTTDVVLVLICCTMIHIVNTFLVLFLNLVFGAIAAS